MASNDSLEQSIMSEPVDSLFFAIARRRSEQKCETARVTRAYEASLQGEDQFVRNSNPDKSLDNNRISVLDDGDGLIGADDLVLQLQSANPRVGEQAPPVPS